MELVAITAGKALLTRILHDAGVAPCFSVETEHRDVIPLVVGGAGAALIPVGTAPDAQVRGAVICRVDPPVTRQVLLVHRRSELTPAAAAFVEVTAEVVAAPSTAGPMAPA
jgi:hypothetical protein